MSTLTSTTLPDEPLTGVITDDDEIEVAVTDEPESPIELAPRRGQNEEQDDGFEPEAAARDDSDPDLHDLENPTIKNRIMRERRLAREAREQLLAAEERNQNLLLDAELRMAATQRDSAKVAIDGIDLRIRTAIEAMKVAKADGDINAEVELSNQLRDLDRVRNDLLGMSNQIPSEQQLRGRFEEYRSRRRQELSAGQSRDAGIQSSIPMAQKWIDNNGWVNKAENKVAQSHLLALGEQLVKDGYDVNSAEYYTELSKHMAKRFPELGIRDSSGRSLTQQRSRPQNGAAPPVASARVTTQRTPAGKSRTRVELDGNDRRMIRIMGLDPSDKTVRERFAREKLARLRSDHLAGGRS